MITTKSFVSNTKSEKSVSIIKLISNPQRYNGKYVRVIGYLNLEFEGNALYFHQVDYEQSISKNAIWVDLSRDSLIMPKIKICNKNYVLIEGVYDADENGHMGSFSGSIKGVKRLEIWNPIKTQ